MTYVRLLVLALGCGLSGWLGFRVADGAAAQRELAVATAYANWGESALAGVRQAFETESERAVSAAEARGRAAALAQRVKHDAAQDVDRSCEWRADHRMRIETVYAAYGIDPAAPDHGVRASVRTPTGIYLEPRGVGFGDTGLGPGLRLSAQ
jgi:hypothetical protein